MTCVQKVVSALVMIGKNYLVDFKEKTDYFSLLSFFASWNSRIFLEHSSISSGLCWLFGLLQMGHISSPPLAFGGSVIMILIVRIPIIKKAFVTKLYFREFSIRNNENCSRETRIWFSTNGTTGDRFSLKQQTQSTTGDDRQ